MNFAPPAKSSTNTEGSRNPDQKKHAGSGVMIMSQMSTVAIQPAQADTNPRICVICN